LQATGAVAIGCVAPSFFRPPSLDLLIAWLAGVARAAPALPFYYYFFPDRNGVSFNPLKLLERLHGDPGMIPTFRGVKFTSDGEQQRNAACRRIDLGACADFSTMSYCAAFANRKYDILPGRDAALMGALGLVRPTMRLDDNG
jgi:dihydrodipicolinate synthase/N-acetylneuraminate lyase